VDIFGREFDLIWAHGCANKRNFKDKNCIINAVSTVIRVKLLNMTFESVSGIKQEPLDYPEANKPSTGYRYRLFYMTSEWLVKDL